MRLEEIMSTLVVAVEPEERAGVAWLTMQRERIRHLVVMVGPRLVGVLSERDLGGNSGADLRRGRVVRELMAARVATASPGTTLRQAANVMRGRLVGCLPVLQGDRVVGIVTATDVLEELGRGPTRPTVRAKSASGSTAAAQTPAYIRSVGVAVDRADRDYLRRKLGRKLGKFATAIERVSVRIEDTNGPRGGVDKRCEIKVVLSGLPSVVVAEQNPSLQAAMDRALDRTARSVQRVLQRRKTRAMRR